MVTIVSEEKGDLKFLSITFTSFAQLNMEAGRMILARLVSIPTIRWYTNKTLSIRTEVLTGRAGKDE